MSSKTEIFRTHTHELAISGTGFNRMFKPEIEFDPPIDLSQMFMEVSHTQDGVVLPRAC